MVMLTHSEPGTKLQTILFFFVCLANEEAEMNAEKVNKRDKRKTCMSTMLHQLIG